MSRSPKKLKKDLRNQVEATLNTTLVVYNGAISPKKLKRNIKRASKILLEGLKLTPPEKASAKKKDVVLVTAEQ